MRQQLDEAGVVAPARTDFAQVLGIGRRVRGLCYSLGKEDEEDVCTGGTPRGARCALCGGSRSTALAVRASIAERGLAPAAPAFPARMERHHLRPEGGERHASTRSKGAALLNASVSNVLTVRPSTLTSAAKAIAALAGDEAGLRGLRSAAPPRRQTCHPVAVQEAVSGPRLFESFDEERAASGSCYWAGVGPSTEVDEVASRLERVRSDLQEELTLTEEVGVRLAEVQAAVEGLVDLGSAAMAEGDSERPAVDSGPTGTTILDKGSLLTGTAATCSDYGLAEVGPEEVEVTKLAEDALAVRPAAASAARSSSPQDADSAEDGEDATAASPERSEETDAMIESLRKSRRRRPRWRLPRLRRRPLKGEALQKRRREMLQQALAEPPHIQDLSKENAQRRSAAMAEQRRVQWKPGDPFAGTNLASQFRWHAMFLTAGCVAGLGYVGLRLLLHFKDLVG